MDEDNDQSSDENRFKRVQDLLEEGDVPYFSMVVVAVFDQEGKRHTYWDIEGDAPMPVVVGEIEMAKIHFVMDNYPTITRRKDKDNGDE